jgi:hypothetical protein
MRDWVDAVDHTPGSPPDVRLIGSSVIMVMPINDDSIAQSNVRLVLRLEANGDLFAAISSPLDRAE